MTHERPLPPLPLPRAAVVVLLLAGFAAVMVWFFRDHDLLLPIVLFGIIALANFFITDAAVPSAGAVSCFGETTFLAPDGFDAFTIATDAIAWDRREIGDDNST